jgi:hypothetical protein
MNNFDRGLEILKKHGFVECYPPTPIYTKDFRIIGSRWNYKNPKGKQVEYNWHTKRWYAGFFVGA